MKKRVLASLLAAVCVVSMMGQIVIAKDKANLSTQEVKTRVLAKSDSGNPMLGFDANGNSINGGDPSILVDGDTVYCYVGQDVSNTGGYDMPRWFCYSSKDMKNWKYESIIMENKDTWSVDGRSAWASQVMKYKGKYYFYYSSEYKDGKGIGVAVSDKPTGPFVDMLSAPLVPNSLTTDSVHAWEDIDPTAWIETDEKGEDHIYLGWGNTRFFVCEMEQDMKTIKDLDGNGKIEMGKDIILGKINGMDKNTFTEAPYYYRQQDENGKYFGKYYMFFASDWREQMAYATTDDILSNEWDFGGVIMEPSATSNTNHMAVFDFKGQTYFVYHDGSLPGGNGGRRVACVEPIEINKDGTIDYIEKTATGLTGTASTIKDSNGELLAHEPFANPLADNQYPIVNRKVMCDLFAEDGDASWEINPGKANKVKAEYVSIESNNKPGLYLTVQTDKKNVVLAQDAGGTQDEAERMTFRTIEGLSGKGVTFESVKYPGYYLVSNNGALSMSSEPDKKQATFFVSDQIEAKSVQALKTKRYYAEGDKLNVDDLKVRVCMEDGKMKEIKEYETNASEIDMSKAGEKKLTVSFTYDGKEYESDIKITVVDKEYVK